MITSLREIHILSEPNSYFLRVDVSGRGLASGFQLLLSDGQDAWRGEVSAAMVCEEVAELEMQTQKYVDNLQEALTGTGDSGCYCFTLKPSPPTPGVSVTLTYEKVQGDISFRLGSAVMSVVPEAAVAVRQLLIHSLDQENTLQRQNHKLEEENQRLREEHQRVAAEIKSLAHGKEALEAELYSRFVLVLNEKKAKIRSLQEAVKDLQEVSCRPSKQQTKEDSVGPAAAQSNDYAGSTDEELEERPSTSATTQYCPESSTPSPLDGSLNDITDVAPTRKRRFRLLEPQDSVVKRPQPPQKTRSDSPAAANKQQMPRRCTDAAAASSAAEDLFADF